MTASYDEAVRARLSLVELEIQYGVLLSPEVFSQVSSFDGLVAMVASQLGGQHDHPDCEQHKKDKQQNQHKIQTHPEHPQIVRLFQRAINFCATLTQLRKFTTLFEARLTPVNIATPRIIVPIVRSFLSQ